MYGARQRQRRMKRPKIIGSLLLVLFAWVAAERIACGAVAPAVSGQVVDGVRVVEVAGAPPDLRITVYRGDYVRFRLTGSDAAPVLSIPDLSVRRTLTADPSDYVKMETAGVFAFSLGAARGTIAVVDYREAAYREVAPAEFAALMREGDPLVLDVRTPAENARGRIPGSTLIPLQQLQSRLSELSGFKDRPILIYCATGNRSTAAAKILIDNGFNRVVNLRSGISGWEREKMPIER
jgi:rhodanese-related sulfurtransferase